MERYVCIHGHFYQPPRENPWLEAVETQDSAAPYHDWNERVTAECYAPNSAARILGSDGRIRRIVSNYERMSFNFGPTLLSWLEEHDSEIYVAILNADRHSARVRSGHGNAIAQVYNHIIMPLANRRDKLTQVRWGVRDFVRRFKRLPEGMWLAEMAVDLESLDIMVQTGIRFTILTQRQAAAVRRIGARRWTDVSGGRIDPSRAYLLRLPSGRTISLFFQDEEIGRAVAFGDALKSGEGLAHRLAGGFSERRPWPQLIHIATDGETYGHHHKFGEMALGCALEYLEARGLAKLANYGEFLEKHQPDHEVRIIENSSWSCPHGVERWRGYCGCNSGGRPEWSQEWRRPLREALDWLRDELASRFETQGGRLFKDPWEARDDYIELLLDRSAGNVERYLEKHRARGLTEDEGVIALKLLEIQRHALLMYTSCGWFFDELSGLETVQALRYAGRCMQLAVEVFHEDMETPFRAKLAAAGSNIPGMRDGAAVYDRFVKPAMIGLLSVGAHYGVSSLFEDYPKEAAIFRFKARRVDFRKEGSNAAAMAVGKVALASAITGESALISFAVLHFGSHLLNGGVRFFRGDEEYGAMVEKMLAAFSAGDFAEAIRLMDGYFGMHTYSLRDLFEDERRKVLKRITGGALEDYGNEHLRLYERDRRLMGFLQEVGMPLPEEFLATAEIALNRALGDALAAEKVGKDEIVGIVDAMRRWGVKVHSGVLEAELRERVENCLRRAAESRDPMPALEESCLLLEVAGIVPIYVDLWRTQNIYSHLAQLFDRRWRPGPGGGAEAGPAARFRELGRQLNFDVEMLLQENCEEGDADAG